MATLFRPIPQKDKRRQLNIAYVYKITNQIDQKVYIGKTLDTIEGRWKEHCKDAKKRNFEVRPLYRAINKYGAENFAVEEIEECDPDLASEREVYWIEKLETFKNGYNATLGGDGKHYIDYDAVVASYKALRNVSKVSRQLGISRSTVHYILKNYNISIISSGEQTQLKSKEKPVAKCDKITGEILEVYPSVAVAETNNKNSRHIGDVCRGKRKTCQGYIWRYV